MAKKNRISVGAWERIAKDMDKETVVTVDWHGEQLEIKRRLTLEEVILLTDKVLSDCFVNDVFHAEVKDFAFNRAAVLLYTNLSLPVNPEKQYELILRTDIMDQIMNHVDPYQYGALQIGIDNRIDALLDTNAEVVNRQLAKISAALDEAGKLFDGVSSDDMQKLVGAMSGMELDPEALMKAYMVEKTASQSDDAQEGPVTLIELKH